jgi:LuxR family maltose regulon positive regulatory protein
VIVSRRDPPMPVASMRARGELTEIRAADLRFSVSETAHLLSQHLHREVDQATAAELVSRTEGWVTAIHLAALSMRYGSPDASPDITVKGDSAFLQEYLLTEVLSNLPAHWLDWIFAAAHVDRFCAPLCEALCGDQRWDTQGVHTGEQFIKWLVGTNLFTIPLDDQRRWFRFHHLFQRFVLDSLGRRRDADTIATLHLRASRWFEENELLDEAIRHALAGKDIDAAVRIVVEHRYDLMNTEQWHRLDAWMKMLPDTAIETSPPLTGARYFLAVHYGNTAEVDDSRQKTEGFVSASSPNDAGSAALHGEFAVMRNMFALSGGDADSMIRRGDRALQLLPPEALHIREIAVGTVIVGHQMNDELEAGRAVLREALSSPSLAERGRAKLLNSWSLACIMNGDLGEVLASSAQCLQISEQQQLPAMVTSSRHNLGVNHYLRNELDLAEPLLRDLYESRAASAPTYVAYGAFALALVHVALGNAEDAEQLLADLCDYYPLSLGVTASKVARACRVELQVRLGHIAEAVHMSATVDFDFLRPIWFFWTHQLTPIKMMLAEGSPGKLTTARELLTTMDSQMRGMHRKSVRIDVLALLAVVCDAQGDTAAAQEHLAVALELAQPGGFIRNFVDLGPQMLELLIRLRTSYRGGDASLELHTDRILDAFTPDTDEQSPESSTSSRNSHVTPTKQVDALTERESQILILLATELSPKEMSDELVVSTATVRTHISNIYQKLGTHSRFQTVQRAQELSLL